MNRFQKLDRFPLGTIHAEGFLKDQMVISKDGLTGNLYKLEPDMIADPFVRDFRVSAWSEARQAGWAAEISGNYWGGYIQAAFTLNDTEMIAIATEWVEGTIALQREDGYMGTYRKESGAKMLEDYNAWGTNMALRGMIAFYEATDRKDVLDAVHRCLLWFCENWAGNKKTKYAGLNLIESMLLCYNYTGDERLVSFCVDYAEFLCSNEDYFSVSYKAMSTDHTEYNANHTAGYCVDIRVWAMLYAATGDEKYLYASAKMIQKIRDKSNNLSGSPVSVAEYLGPVGATMETEYCNYTFFNCTYSYMSYITGETKYGDYMEELFYNGAQGARKKDEKAIAYLNSPNQVYATMDSSTSMEDRQAYAPCHPVSCCPVNAVLLLPEFIRGMLLRDGQDNVYVMAYGPCDLKYKDIHITEKTLYPFRNSAAFEIHCNKQFALNLKVPEWSKGFTVKINGQAVSSAANAENYVVLDRSWTEGDVVEIAFQAAIQVIKVDDTDSFKKYPLAVKYGALLFAYHIPEDWQPIPGTPNTPLPEGWSWFNVMPVPAAEPSCEDMYDNVGLVRYRTTWNIAVDEAWAPEDFTIEELPENGYVWSNPVIQLHTHCYKAPHMYGNYPVKTMEPFGEYHTVTDKLPLTLVPYGCTNLRIAYFYKARL